ncbi:MAG TPA: BlaI/MecI/CopY family transcriptional regulator [Candidatus Angelobacter sp.]|jgi:predicted transcriptional regulator|nr:BlaI/MecI/CopY family transcriptional regulator [Candidatus Angelobacter sp.]
MTQGEAKLTSAQLEIMNLFWEHGELGVAQVRELLKDRRPKAHNIARNTVQTMLKRLADRGWLQTRAQGNAFVFRAARPRKSTLRGMLAQLLDGAFGGSPSGLVMTLMESRRISPTEARRIRELIDRMEEAER